MTTKRKPAGPVRMKPFRRWAVVNCSGVCVYHAYLKPRFVDGADRIARVEVREVVRKRRKQQ